MSVEKTKIDWAESTWNPVTGCYHGCEYCYARGIAIRFGEFMRVDGTDIKMVNGRDERICVEVAYKSINPYPEKFTPTLHRHRLGEYAEKKGRNIFVCSMADLFGAWVPDSWIDEIMTACVAAPQHNYLFLSKNVERYCEYGVSTATDNLWYGTTITTEKEMSNFNYLPAHCKTFVSIEPLLEDLKPENYNILFRQIDWVIIGAETGRRKNKVVPERKWIKDIVNRCREFGTPVFMKSSLANVWGEPLIQEFPKEMIR